MTYIVSGGALNSTHSLLLPRFKAKLDLGLGEDHYGILFPIHGQ